MTHTEFITEWARTNGIKLTPGATLKLLQYISKQNAEAYHKGVRSGTDYPWRS